MFCNIIICIWKFGVLDVMIVMGIIINMILINGGM